MSNTTCAMPERRPTPAEILDTPLPDLLAETGVELLDSSITDSGFCGAVVQRRGRDPPGDANRPLSQIETDIVTGDLIAQVFDVKPPSSAAVHHDRAVALACHSRPLVSFGLHPSKGTITDASGTIPPIHR